MSQTTAAASGSQRRVLATPLARAVAADLGVDLASVTGSGRAGRILRADVEAAAAAGAAPAGAVDNRAHPTFRSATLPDGGRHTAAAVGPRPESGRRRLSRTSS
jgi:pyruvate/2-oxoglutarate dehydrogenase complex dihydrolipoamide acyltransferase (E2) component